MDRALFRGLASLFFVLIAGCALEAQRDSAADPSASASVARALTYTTQVTGTVRSSTTSAPIPWAKVTYTGSASGYVIADRLGQFRIVRTFGSESVLHLVGGSQIGEYFDSDPVTIHIPEQGTARVDFVLRPSEYLVIELARQSPNPAAPPRIDWLVDINDSDVVAGEMHYGGLNYGPFIWRDSNQNHSQDVGETFFGSIDAYAVTIDVLGRVAGFSEYRSPPYPFLYFPEGNTWRRVGLGDLSLMDPTPYFPGEIDINDAGEVVGTTARGDFNFTEQVAYVLRPTDVNGDGAPDWYWSTQPYGQVNTLMTPIPGCTRATHINNGGDILAQCSTFVRWRDIDRDGIMGDFEVEDLGSNAPSAMNNRGDVVGRAPDGNAFFWSDATGFHDLGANIVARDINDKRQVVGRSPEGAFLWTDANVNGLRDPGEWAMLDSLVPSSFGRFVDARAINECGSILVHGGRSGFAVLKPRRPTCDRYLDPRTFTVKLRTTCANGTSPAGFQSRGFAAFTPRSDRPGTYWQDLGVGGREQVVQLYPMNQWPGGPPSPLYLRREYVTITGETRELMPFRTSGPFRIGRYLSPEKWAAGSGGAFLPAGTTYVIDYLIPAELCVLGT